MIQAGGGGGPIWRPNPQNVMTRNLAMDTNINRYDKPVKTSVWRTELPIPNAIMMERKVKTTAAEVGWNRYSYKGVVSVGMLY